MTAGAGFDEEEAELGDVLRIADAIDRPDALTVQLGDPGGLPLWVVLPRYSAITRATSAAKGSPQPSSSS